MEVILVFGLTALPVLVIRAAVAVGVVEVGRAAAQDAGTRNPPTPTAAAATTVVVVRAPEIQKGVVILHDRRSTSPTHRVSSKLTAHSLSDKPHLVTSIRSPNQDQLNSAAGPFSILGNCLVLSAIRKGRKRQ